MTGKPSPPELQTLIDAHINAFNTHCRGPSSRTPEGYASGNGEACRVPPRSRRNQGVPERFSRASPLMVAMTAIWKIEHR